ncbi:MAG: LysR family transcriptional regulator, partial [Myxococcales bacterium]|nr:LysR family transcriptional regulator [Myxococcales bacterium]
MALTLDALEVLDAVDRAGSFGSAARALHRAQSAVSYAIRQLEEALGVALFDR